MRSVIMLLVLSGCASFDSTYMGSGEFVTYQECYMARMRREISDVRLFQCAVELPEYGFKVQGE